MMYPEFPAQLREFATSKSRWMKRTAAVSLIIPTRRVLFLKGTLAIADILLPDADDLVQKGYR
ncbi:hypothetical protein SD074_09210 [Prolixibacter sp. SD074]|jgi:3-methyladenine DNA glycosylase AlkD|nr:hypothetical protein SD074_09210 [Prolixibacter sp. SD074]